jgi:DNA-binding Xre family transcriptional regulator
MVRLKVKEVARQKGFSMGRLSRMSDVAYNTIKRIYDDPAYSPTVNTLVKIATTLGVSIAELVEVVPDEDKKAKRQTE